MIPERINMADEKWQKVRETFDSVDGLPSKYQLSQVFPSGSNQRQSHVRLFAHSVVSLRLWC